MIYSVKWRSAFTSLHWWKAHPLTTWVNLDCSKTICVIQHVTPTLTLSHHLLSNRRSVCLHIHSVHEGESGTAIQGAHRVLCPLIYLCTSGVAVPPQRNSEDRIIDSTQIRQNKYYVTWNNLSNIWISNTVQQQQWTQLQRVHCVMRTAAVAISNCCA